MTLSTATLDEGAALLAALGNAHTNDAQCTAEDRLLRWLLAHAAELLAAARQAQDNAKDAERWRWVRRSDADVSRMFALSSAGLALGVLSLEQLDAAIDAAITAATPGKGDG